MLTQRSGAKVHSVTVLLKECISEVVYWCQFEILGQDIINF